jgi:hypothetical protein
MSETEHVTDVVKEGFIAKLIARGREWLSGVSQHCRDVEAAKDACERKNLEQHGKDWVNRCCG